LDSNTFTWEPDMTIIYFAHARLFRAFTWRRLAPDSFADLALFLILIVCVGVPFWVVLLVSMIYHL